MSRTGEGGGWGRIPEPSSKLGLHWATNHQLGKAGPGEALLEEGTASLRQGGLNQSRVFNTDENWLSRFQKPIEGDTGDCSKE